MDSFHKSFCFGFLLLAKKRHSDFKYLLENWYKPKKEVTKEFFIQKIEELEKILKN